jgi:hypothetical protein
MAELRNLSRIIQYRDEKANIEALAAVLEETSFAFSTDTAELGIYTNGSWFWISVSNSGQNVGHAHALVRWNGASGQTTFELPDVAEYIEALMLNGLEEDPFLYSLSSDRTQIVLASALPTAMVVQAHYVIAQI